MSPTLRIVLIAAMIFYFILLLGFVRRRGLNLKYFLLWLFMGLVLLVLILAIVTFGIYGSGFDNAAFLYTQF